MTLSYGAVAILFMQILIGIHFGQDTRHYAVAAWALEANAWQSAAAQAT